MEYIWFHTSVKVNYIHLLASNTLRGGQFENC